MKLLPEPVSPCISICQLDETGLCTGCWRTIDEITAWGSLPAQGKQQILNNIESRRAQAETDADADASTQDSDPR